MDSKARSASESAGAEIVTIIGSNGSGKSRLLGDITWRAGASLPREVWPLSRRAEGAICAISNTVHDRFRFPLKPSRNYRYMGLRRSTNALFSGAMTQVAGDGLLEVALDPGKGSSMRLVLEKIECPSASLIVQASRKSEAARRRDRGRIEKLTDLWRGDGPDLTVWSTHYVPEVVSNLLQGEEGANPPHLLPLESGASSPYWIDILRNFVQDMRCPPWVAVNLLQTEVQLKYGFSVGGEGQDAPEEYFSAGEMALFSMFARINAAAGEEVTILLDEPEAGLHPEWQAEFVPMLRNALRKFPTMQVLIATHSPYVAADSDRIFMPKPEGGFECLPFDHRGLSVDEVMYYVFGSRVIGSYLIERDLVEVMSWMSKGDSKPPSVAVENAAWALSRAGASHSEVLRSVLKEYRDKVAELG